MLYDAERGDFSLMLLGDVMPTRRLAVFDEARYLQLRTICTGADATFANLETCVHHYFEGHQNISGGTYMTTEPHLLDDLKWLGVNFVSTANNHAYDYGEEGIVGHMPLSGRGRHRARRQRAPLTRGARAGISGYEAWPGWLNCRYRHHARPFCCRGAAVRTPGTSGHQPFASQLELCRR